MKNVLIAISALFYLAVSSGVIINIHYCMKRVDSVKFYAEPSDMCGRCGMHTDDANGCCHDELKVIKITDDQLASKEILYTAGLMEVPVSAPSAFLSSPFENILPQQQVPVHPPPLLKGQETHLQNCVFRI